MEWYDISRLWRTIDFSIFFLSILLYMAIDFLSFIILMEMQDWPEHRLTLTLNIENLNFVYI